MFCRGLRLHEKMEIQGIEGEKVEPTVGIEPTTC